MAAIEVRTQRGTYGGGETIYGAVYLRVDAPTGGYGIRLKFFGYETYLHRNSLLTSQRPTFGSSHGLRTARLEADTEENAMKNTKEYVDSHDIKLYEFEGPIALGCYVFPFQKRLQRDIPGTFHYSCDTGAAGEPGTVWECQVVYQVEAEMIGAESVKASQQFVVRQVLVNAKDGKVKIQKNINIKGFFFSNNTLLVQATLDKLHYNVGDAITLVIDIGYHDHGCKQIRVTRMSVKLKRDFNVFLTRDHTQGSSLNNNRPTNAAQRDLNPFTFLPWPVLCGNDSELIQPVAAPSRRPQRIRPESEPVTLWESQMTNRNGVPVDQGIKKFVIPLQDLGQQTTRDSHFQSRSRLHNAPAVRPPTTLLSATIGAHIACVYYVEVEVSVKGAEDISLLVPVPSVTPAATQWEAWEPPLWTSNCEQRNRHGDCNPPDDLLDTPTFSSLPSFQAI